VCADPPVSSLLDASTHGPCGAEEGTMEVRARADGAGALEDNKDVDTDLVASVALLQPPPPIVARWEESERHLGALRPLSR
jgi:hypothetical protein